MWVGVCCECQQGGKPLRWHPSGGYVIDYHESFGSSCEGEGTAPQATYQAASGSDQMPSGIQVVNGNDLKIVKSLFPEHNVRSPDVYPDDLPDAMADPHAFDRSRAEQAAFDDAYNAKHGYALSDCPKDQEAEDTACCFDPWRSTVVDRETNVSRNHRPDPPKPPGVFGTIGDLLLAAKNGKQKTKKRG